MRRGLFLVLAILMGTTFFLARPAQKSVAATTIPWIQVGFESGNVGGSRSTPQTITLAGGYSVGIFFSSATLTGNITGVTLLGNCHTQSTGGSMTLSGSSSAGGYSASATYAITLGNANVDCVQGIGGT